MCDLSSVSIVYPCYWIGWCVHVIHITHPNPQVRIHTYTRCLSHIRVATHMCPGAVWQREKYIYLKTVSQLSKFVQSVLFTDIHSIIYRIIVSDRIYHFRAKVGMSVLLV
jgi:hypothetical protein